MRKFLSVVGSLFLLLVLAVAAFIGYAAYHGKSLDASSKAYVESNVPAILGTWSKDELLKRASPQLLKMIGEKPGQLDQLFQKLSTLGAMKTFTDVKGDSSLVYTTREGKVTTATYTANAQFEKGEGKITVRLVQVAGQWQILLLHIDSPLFLQ